MKTFGCLKIRRSENVGKAPHFVKILKYSYFQIPLFSNPPIPKFSNPQISKSPNLRINILFVFCFFCVQVFAQKPSSNKRAQAAFAEAGRALRMQDRSRAEQLLLDAVARDPAFATAWQQLGDVYRQDDRYEKAVTAYQKVLETDATLTPLTLFGLGESLLFTGQYASAKRYLERYRALGGLGKKSLAQIDKYLIDCVFSLENQQTGEPYVPKKLGSGINTADDEYFPKLTANNKTIIFTRKTKNRENFYESHLIGEEWTEAEKLIGFVNSDDFNEGAHCISPDGKYLFFTGCNRPDGMGSCDIYVSRQENGVWAEPHNLGAPINTRGWESQPAISADGRTLYFVSNRQGGMGGHDIYKSTLGGDGSWSAPQNLGRNINTPFDESSPHIHADNRTLYFASDGWPGFGRKDIFMSQMDETGEWSVPQNMGRWINDFRDQTALHVSMNGRIAHLASQDSTGQLDIFCFTLPEHLQPQSVAFIKGKVLHFQGGVPLDAKIRVIRTDGNEVVFEDWSDPEDGEFLATLPIGSGYAVHVEKEGFLFGSQQYALDDPRHTNEEFAATILLKPIEKGAFGQLNNIYFDIDKADLLPQSTADVEMLWRFLMLNPHVSIEIGGHTDNTGNEQANQMLSENRAKAVRDFLVNKDIPPNRITVKGYGQSVPVADNETEEGRRLNRRTEFRIL